MEERYYFAYGSNMNLNQMEFRCPAAKVVENVRLDGYRLAFGGTRSDHGVATIIPEEGSYVEGVLWSITSECEASLDRYEGYPHLYGKEMVTVRGEGDLQQNVAVYIMNAPYKDCPSIPSDFYLKGIVEGCHQNGISTTSIQKAVKRTHEEIKATEQRNKSRHRGWTR